MKDEVVLSPHLFWIWKAFADLSYRRPIGFSAAMPIPFMEIHGYCALKGIDSPYLRDRLTHFIGILDHAWMQEQAKNRERERGSNSTPPPPSHSPPRDRTGRGSRRTQQVT